jgi:biotin transport system substrate-specific component
METKMLENQNNIAVKESGLEIGALQRVFWVFAFIALTAVGARIEIMNQPVPFTLQTFFVLLSGALLGKRDGAISMGLYVILGAAGLPVFSGGAFGIARIMGPTGGYLLSFPAAALIVGYLASLRKEYWWMLVSMVAGSAVIFIIGTVQLNTVYLHNWNVSFRSGFLIFSWWDAVKIVGAASIAQYYFRRVGPRKNLMK